MSLEEEKYYVSLGMQKFGGSFIRHIGIALAHAHRGNAVRIKETWPEDWAHYLDVGQREEERRRYGGCSNVRGGVRENAPA